MISRDTHHTIFGSLLLASVAVIVAGIIFGVGMEIYENWPAFVNFWAGRRVGTVMAFAGALVLVVVVTIGWLTDPRV